MAKNNKNPQGAPLREKLANEAEVVFQTYKPRSLMAKLRGYLMGGILVTAPVGITFYISWLFIKYVDRKVTALVPEVYRPENYLAFSIPGLGLVVVIFTLIFIGWLTAGLIGRFLVRFTHSIMARVPVARSIYLVVKQFLETVVSDRSSAFKEVVMVEYPRANIWALGFVANTTQGEVQNVTEDKVVSVFLPTTPNPTSGFLLFVPERDLYKLHMTVEDGIKMVISGGIVTPPDRRSKEEREKPVLKRYAHAPYLHERVGGAAKKPKPAVKKATARPKAKPKTK